ncbi:MAG: winged helix-turn-helix domain-containing protein [Steroidobacterales bacterium]
MKPLTVRIRIDFGPGLAIGPGKIALLEGVQRTGSLAQAARDMGMSYRRAWLLMQSLNEAVREPVTVAATGGRHGGGATVTAAGLALIASYRRLERKLLTEARKEMPPFLRAAPRRTNSL